MQRHIIKHTKRSIRRTVIIIFYVSILILPLYSDSPDVIKFQLGKKQFKQGLHFYNRYKYLAAVEFFRKAVQAYPDYYTARDYLARSYKLAGFTDSALREWQSLISIVPHSHIIQHKIDALRYADISPKIEINAGNYILHKIYKSHKFKHHSFTHPTDLAVDNEKNLYITSFDNGSIIKIDTNGKGQFKTKLGYSEQLYGIDYFNNILAVSNYKKNKIILLNKDGTIIHSFGIKGSKLGELFGPEGLIFDKSGNLFVVDSGNNRIQKFTQNGTFILALGSEGSYEGNLLKPTDITMIENRLYITDTGNHRIAVFDQYGNFIKNMFSTNLTEPRGITSHQNKLIISDAAKGILIVDIKTNASQWITGWEENKKFSKLYNIAVDREGYLYALDYNYQSVFLFSPIQRKYSNLTIEITSVDINKFPVIAFYCNVVSRDGSPIYGLKSNNFKITEDGAVIKNIYSNYLKRMQPSTSISLLIDRSLQNKSNHWNMPWLANFILNKMHTKDKIEVINFHQKVWAGNKFDWSKRRTLRAIKKMNYSSGKDFGSAIYLAISNQLSSLKRRAIVCITNGNVNQNSFRKYTARQIINYAKIHFIPIYFISIKKPNTVLVKIANKTGGKIIRTRNLDLLRSLYNKIKKQEDYRYVLVYSSYKIPAFKGMWADIKIEISHKGQKGVEHSGYFIPEK